MQIRHLLRRGTLVRAILAGTLLALPVRAQSVIEVGQGAGMDVFLSSAYLSAQDGDTILVEDGYATSAGVDAGLSITKSLDIVSAGHSTLSAGYGPALDPDPAIVIHDLGPDQHVLVRGFHIGWTPTTAFAGVPGVVLDACQGPIVFEDCSFASTFEYAITAVDCASITFVRCTIESLLVEASNVVLHDSVVVGIPGNDGLVIPPPFNLSLPPGPGAPGLRMRASSSLYSSGCSFTGGVGGSPDGYCLPGADGGPAIDVTDDLPCTIRTRDSSFTSGSPSVGNCGEADGGPSAPLSLGTGTQHTLLAGTARAFAMSTPVLVGGDLAFDFDGEPGDQAFLVLSALPSQALWLPVSMMTLHLLPPLAVVGLGPLPTGDLHFELTVPSLPPGIEGLGVWGQGYLQPASGLFHLTGPSMTTLLAP